MTVLRLCDRNLKPRRSSLDSADADVNSQSIQGK